MSPVVLSSLVIKPTAVVISVFILINSSPGLIGWLKQKGQKKPILSFSSIRLFFFLFPPHPPPKEKANQTSSTIYCFERNCLFLLFLLGFVLWAQKQNTTDFFFFPFCSDQGDEFDFFFFALSVFFSPSLITKASLRCVRVGCFFVCVFFSLTAGLG